MGTRYDGTLRWTEDEHAFDEPHFTPRAQNSSNNGSSS
jgi:hypothetical protein